MCRCAYIYIYTCHSPFGFEVCSRYVIFIIHSFVGHAGGSVPNQRPVHCCEIAAAAEGRRLAVLVVAILK